MNNLLVLLIGFGTGFFAGICLTCIIIIIANGKEDSDDN